MQVNHAHDGVRLGQALYKVAKRAGVSHKVKISIRLCYTHVFYLIGYVTCDNASNNNTMMDEFGRLVSDETGQAFDAHKRRLR